MPDKHHKELPPSSAGAIYHCNLFVPGSDDGPFSDSTAGTEIHLVAQNLVENKYKKNNPAYVYEYNKELLTVSEYESTVECVDDTMNLVKARIHNLQPHQIETEVPVSIVNNRGVEISFGSVDMVVTDGVTFIGVDWKSSFGFNLKNAYHEPQMAFYALALMQKHNINEIIWVEGHILPGRPIPYTLTRDKCESMVQAVWIRRYQAPKKYTPNHYCKYCGRCGSPYQPCPKIIEYADAFGCHVPEDILKLYEGIDKINDGEVMSDLMISMSDQVEQYQKKLVNIVKAVKGHAMALSQTGVPIPYYERSIKSTKKVKKISQAWELIKGLRGVTKERLEEHSSLSVNKLAEANAEDMGLTQAKSKKMFWGKLLAVTEATESYSLKRKKEK